nr:MAG: hypothetical protein [Bacteriophage sp.]
MATAPTYAAHQWEDGEVITAERLNAIENQLAALSAAGGIGTGNIADGAVTSAKIGASAVGAGKIGSHAVAAANIADGVIPTADTLSGATTVGKTVMKATDAAAARTAIGAAAAQ